MERGFGRSKGVGFSSLSTAEQASLAMTGRNGCYAGSLPVYGALAQGRNTFPSKKNTINKTSTENTAIEPGPSSRQQCASRDTATPYSEEHITRESIRSWWPAELFTQSEDPAENSAYENAGTSATRHLTPKAQSYHTQGLPVSGLALLKKIVCQNYGEPAIQYYAMIEQDFPLQAAGDCILRPSTTQNFRPLNRFGHPFDSKGPFISPRRVDMKPPVPKRDLRVIIRGTQPRPITNRANANNPFATSDATLRRGFNDIQNNASYTDLNGNGISRNINENELSTNLKSVVEPAGKTLYEKLGAVLPRGIIEELDLLNWDSSFDKYITIADTPETTNPKKDYTKIWGYGLKPNKITYLAPEAYVPINRYSNIYATGSGPVLYNMPPDVGLYCLDPTSCIINNRDSAPHWIYPDNSKPKVPAAFMDNPKKCYMPWSRGDPIENVSSSSSSLMIPSAFGSPKEERFHRSVMAIPEQVGMIMPTRHDALNGYFTYPNPATIPGFQESRQGVIINQQNTTRLPRSTASRASDLQVLPLVAQGVVLTGKNRAVAFQFKPTSRNAPKGYCFWLPGASQNQRTVLTENILAAADPRKRRELLGERLYPLVQGMYNDLAGRLTGMLLNLDNTRLLHFLRHVGCLRDKVDEAVAILRAYQQMQAGDECK